MLQAFAPHVSQVLAIDDSRGMVKQFNRIAAANKHKYPGCDMRAAQGDLIDRYGTKPPIDSRIRDPDDEYQSFDMVVMCVSHSSLKTLHPQLPYLTSRVPASN